MCDRQIRSWLLKHMRSFRWSCNEHARFLSHTSHPETDNLFCWGLPEVVHVVGGGGGILRSGVLFKVTTKSLHVGCRGQSITPEPLLDEETVFTGVCRILQAQLGISGPRPLVLFFQHCLNLEPEDMKILHLASQSLVVCPAARTLDQHQESAA